MSGQDTPSRSSGKQMRTVRLLIAAPAALGRTPPHRQRRKRAEKYELFQRSYRQKNEVGGYEIRNLYDRKHNVTRQKIRAGKFITMESRVSFVPGTMGKIALVSPLYRD
uniref:Uncharacterized protein n=1 Tax=Vespula pensylvanica TaxID=30213 RepID=A0A834JLW0_VESPE|nr:hypothetical protein H0235_017709 [Vespula pensylvanica]